MDWITIVWSMVIAASLTLGALHAIVGLQQPGKQANLAFAAFALATALCAASELWTLRTDTLAEYAVALRWFHVPVWLLVVSVAAFVRLNLGAGRLWMAALAIGLRTVALALNFAIPQNLNYREITSISHQTILGATVTVARGVPNPWMIVGQMSLVVLVIYVLDAAITVWRRGDTRRALIVGGSLTLFPAVGTAQVLLSFWGIVHMPIMVTPFFLAIAVVMGVDLTRDVLRAAALTQELQLKDVELRSSEAKLSLAAEAAEAGFWSMDVKTGLVWATRGRLEVPGFAPGKEFHLDDFFKVIHHDDEPRVRQTFESIKGANKAFHTEYRAMTSTAGLRWFAIWGRSVPAAEGDSGKLMGVTVDVTERKATEDALLRHRAELAHLSRAASLSVLSGAIAHEINQPLASILSNAQAMQSLLDQGPASEAEVREILDAIVREDRRAADVIKRLRGLLKQGTPNRQPISMNFVVAEMLRLTESDCAARGVKCSVELTDDPAMVSGDAILLQQVLLNLILNACDAVAANPEADRRIAIRTRSTDSTVTMSVVDKGCGLPDDRELVFQPLRSSKTGGLGMGLSICRSIADAHGGKLWAEPNAGPGATFILSLPSARAES